MFKERNELIIVAIEYLEPEYEETRKSIYFSGYQDVIWVDRKGIGSLAKAYNEGFRRIPLGEYKYVLFVSNVVFNSNMIYNLIKEMDRTGYGALHPVFESDHMFCRPVVGSDKVIRTAFIEFTCPIVKYDVFERFPLDEGMPYWGHDLDWGFRVRKAGHKVGVSHKCQVDHVYIRDCKPNPITLKRKELRRASNHSTRVALQCKYGKDWKKVLNYKD